MSAEERDRDEGPSGLAAVPGLVRIGASAWWHATEWTLDTSVRAGRRVMRAASSGESAVELAEDLREAARGVARDIVGVTDIEERVRSAVPQAEAARSAVARAAAAVSWPPQADPKPAGGSSPAPGRSRSRDGSARPATSLSDPGQSLLRLSADVRYEEEAHPAYERILGDLAPDEGRILRLLLLQGPQPAVDVRTGGPLGLLSSQLIAPGLSMIAAHAGCRYRERVPSYLNNLFRLGLIWFSRETLQDPLRYQVLEAQPDVLKAIHSVRQAKLVRRSIHLTPFGEDFCRTCLVLEAAELEELPEHATPDEAAEVTQPPTP